jgi:hypothetical protein
MIWTWDIEPTASQALDGERNGWAQRLLREKGLHPG